MKSWQRDDRTHLSIIKRFVALADLSSADATLIEKELERYMSQRLARNLWMEPEITRFHTYWYRELYRIVGGIDPYGPVKRQSNDLAAKLVAELSLPDLRAAVLASIVSNRIDYGAVDYKDGEIPVARHEFESLASLPLLYDDFETMRERLGRARTLLYLVDNCGEVLFDRVVLERARAISPACRMVVAGKESPMLNDVTADELRALGFADVAEVISTGSNCFGVPEDEVSAAFKAVARDADLIIAKGQSYLEFWIGYDTDKVVNLLTTKFPIHDAVLGEIPSGVAAIVSSERYRGGKKAYRFT